MYNPQSKPLNPLIKLTGELDPFLEKNTARSLNMQTVLTILHLLWMIVGCTISTYNFLNPHNTWKKLLIFKSLPKE